MSETLTPPVLAELKRLSARANPPDSRVDYSIESAYSELVWLLGDYAPALIAAAEERVQVAAERDSLKDDLAGIEDALASAGVWGNAECEAPTMIEAIECLAEAYRTVEAERDALQSKVSIAEETGVQFCELEDGGVGCSVPMSKELDDATGAIVTLTDQRDALALELKSETLRYCGATQELGKLQGLCDSQATEIERMRTLDIYRCRDLDILTEQLKALGDERNAIREERDTLQCKLADVTHMINQREAAIREAINTRFASHVTVTGNTCRSSGQSTVDSEPNSATLEDVQCDAEVRPPCGRKPSYWLWVGPALVAACVIALWLIGGKR